jgi:hypothetical protein
MTFLQYVCERLLGKPRRVGGSPGESYWTCPFCGRYAEAFHTFPHKPGLKDRWSCWKCGMRGDEFDLMRHCYPGEDYPRRRVRLDEWRQDFDREGKAAEALVDRGGGGTRGSHSSPGDGGKEKVEPAHDPAWETERAYKEMTDKERSLLASAAVVSWRHGMHCSQIEALCRYEEEEARSLREWVQAHNDAHMAECSDPECDYDCCRLARGWTKEQIRADVERARQTRAARNGRAHR